MDIGHETFDVYTDADAAGNHFSARGRFNSAAGDDHVPPMIENSTENPHSGITCIKASFKSRGSNWGGWYFMNGVLKGNERSPSVNWGDVPNAGIDLRGATRLTFYARGAEGDERVEFFALGVGWSVESGRPTMPHPDSSPKASLGYVTLTTEWRRYTIDLTGKNLSYVLGGFGWVTAADRNRYRDISFYLDDIQFDKARLDEPRFLVSFDTIQSAALIIVSDTRQAAMGSPRTTPHKHLILNRLKQRTIWCADSRAKVAETMINASNPNNGIQVKNYAETQTWN
jgi:hypothetical protein